MTPEAALVQYRTQQALKKRAVRAALARWSQVRAADLTGSFTPVLGGLLADLTAWQLLAAQGAEPYVRQVLREQGLDAAAGDVTALPVPRSLAGVASDGRPLQTLLTEPLIATKSALLRQVDQSQALAAGALSLTRIVATQVADAGRLAESLSIAVRPRVGGYVRMLTPPSCARCAVQAGRFFRWNQGFQRHPLCDCRHIPSAEDVAGDLRTDPRAAVEAGQVTGLSAVDRQAIQDGADVSQVVNAHRSARMVTAYGRRLSSTLEGVTRRGRFGAAEFAAGRDPTRGPRLTPEAIYGIAGDDRSLAVQLLKRYGFVL